MIANIAEKMLKEDWKQMADFVRVRPSFRPFTFTFVLAFISFKRPD